MIKFWTAAALATAMCSPAAAIEATAAQQMLVGAWVGPGETWVFGNDGSWQQFVGGVTTDSSFTTEAMPENLFVLISGTSGRRYVVHAGSNPRVMSVFPEGKTDSLGTYIRRD